MSGSVTSDGPLLLGYSTPSLFYLDSLLKIHGAQCWYSAADVFCVTGLHFRHFPYLFFYLLFLSIQEMGMADLDNCCESPGFISF